MAILVDEFDENAAEFPYRKEWFDASRWLKEKQYVKVNDFYLINTNYTPIDNLNSFSITLTIQFAINHKGGNLPALDALADLDPQLFFKLVKDKLSYEYIYTAFDKKTLTPTLDYFLIRFPYQDKKYEIFVHRELVDDEFLFYGRELYSEGRWHRDFNRLLTYRAYEASQ